MPLSKEQILRVQKNVPMWVELLKKNNVKDFIIPYAISQMINETGWFNNKSYILDRNPGGVTWSEKYIIDSKNRPGTSKGTLRPSGEGGNYVHYDTWDNSAKDWVRILNSNRGGKGRPLESLNITDYVSRLIANGYMANSTGYLKNMKGILNLLNPHIDVASLIKKKTKYNLNSIDRLYAVLFGK
jgi:hypothetical protein